MIVLKRLFRRNKNNKNKIQQYIQWRKKNYFFRIFRYYYRPGITPRRPRKRKNGDRNKIIVKAINETEKR